MLCHLVEVFFQELDIGIHFAVAQTRWTERLSGYDHTGAVNVDSVIKNVKRDSHD
jgi:hypothetical protein